MVHELVYSFTFLQLLVITSNMFLEYVEMPWHRVFATGRVQIKIPPPRSYFPLNLMFSLTLKYLLKSSESKQNIVKKIMVKYESLYYNFFYNFFGGHIYMSFCGATDTPVLDFW